MGSCCTTIPKETHQSNIQSNLSGKYSSKQCERTKQTDMAISSLQFKSFPSEYYTNLSIQFNERHKAKRTFNQHIGC